jgi:hypothetical protein
MTQVQNKAQGDDTDPREADHLWCTIMDGPLQGRKVSTPIETVVGDCRIFGKHNYRYVGYGHFRHVNQGVPDEVLR